MKFLDRFMSKIASIMKAVARSKAFSYITNGLGLAGVGIGLLAAAIVAVASLVGVFAITLALVVMIPSLVVATLSWLVWVYAGAGVTYFPDLPSAWLNVPFMHFWLASALAVAVVRMIKRGTTIKPNGYKKPMTSSEKIAAELSRRSKLLLKK